jgi:hypothetical protein
LAFFLLLSFWFVHLNTLLLSPSLPIQMVSAIFDSLFLFFSTSCPSFPFLQATPSRTESAWFPPLAYSPQSGSPEEPRSPYTTPINQTLSPYMSIVIRALRATSLPDTESASATLSAKCPQSKTPTRKSQKRGLTSAGNEPAACPCSY